MSTILRGDDNLDSALVDVGFFYKSKQGVLFEKTGPSSLKIPSDTSLKVKGSRIDLVSDYTLDLDSDLDTGTKTAGTDYYVYAQDDATFYISEDKDIVTDRLIGGFHYGLIPEAFSAINNITTDDAEAIRGINAYSFWDLQFRPSCNPEGMVFVGGFWVDIYLLNSEHITKGTSSAEGNIAGGSLTYGRLYPKIPLSKGGNGSTTYGSFTWLEANEIGLANEKRLLSYGEFTHIAFGVKEASSANTLDDGLVKHLIDYVSKFGVEQATGCQYSWGSDLVGDTAGTFAWKSNTEGRGSIYSVGNSPNAVILGGDRGNASNSGSRASYWYNCVWYSYWAFGVRFACNHLNLAMEK